MSFAASAGYIALAGLALGAASMADQAGVAGAQASSSKAQTKAAGALGKAQTETSNAESSTMRHVQALNNKRRMQAADKQLAAGNSNFIRQLDSLARGDLESQLQVAEAAGAYSARASSSGTGGASIDAISSTMALQAARKQAAVDKNRGYLTADAAMELAGIVPGTAASLNMDTFTGSQDRSVTLQEVRGGADVYGWLGNSGVLKTMAGMFGGSGGNAGQGLQTGQAWNTVKAPSSGFWATDTTPSGAGISYSLI